MYADGVGQYQNDEGNDWVKCKYLFEMYKKVVDGKFVESDF